jgi:predicted RNase H-like HicB family nuclease
MKYSILIQYDERDNIYIAAIPELQGCMAHGDSPKEAMSELQTAMELWLETAKENCTEIPHPRVYAR